MYDDYHTRTPKAASGKKKRRGRPTQAAVDQRPPAQPAQYDDDAGRYRCQHCGRPTLRVYKTHDSIRYLRCETGCGAKFAMTGLQLQRLEAPKDGDTNAA